MSDVRSKVWIQKDDEHLFPEQHDPNVKLVGENTGVCFSGGGTRALSAAMGQMRALDHLGLFKTARYISSVSGGTWASALFTYYNSGPGLAGDSDFLGEVRHGEITYDSLEELPEQRLGHAATTRLETDLLQLLKLEDPPPRLWLDAVGEDFFQPYGLYDPSSPAYFSYDEATVAAIKAANPSLADATFHTVRPGRPFLVMNSCIVGPTDLAPFTDEELVPFEYTPLYIGTPHALKVDYKGNGSETLPVGGGYVEPFAFGGQAPGAPLADGNPPLCCEIELPAPPRPFSLADAAGTSSSAVAALVEKHKIVDNLGAQTNYWPIGPGQPPAARKFDFGDGGSLENYGLLALLRRKVERLVVFINTPTPLDVDYDPSKPPENHHVDGNLWPLFGYPNGAKKHNQVFSKSDWPKVVGALQDAKRKGDGAVCVGDHEVRANDWWGIEGGWKARICWVYLDRATNWERRKLESGLRKSIHSAWRHFGKFHHFPNYKTTFEDFGHLVQYDPVQVNLLAELTCSVVLDHHEKFESVLGGSGV